MRLQMIHRVIALVLAALWLPAVWHCELDMLEAAAGEHGCCSHDEDGTDGSCVVDPCAIFDEGHFRGAEDGALDVSPECSVLFAVLWEGLVQASAEVLEPPCPAPDPVPDGRSWAFERRAAPLANAPDCIVS